MKTTKIYGKNIDRALSMWVKLARAASVFERLAVQNIRRFGLTEPQFGVLEILGHLGPQTLGDLSRKTLVSAGNITCVVDNLEREGLVERIYSTEDRRTTLARLTPSGKAIFEEIFIRHAEHIAELASVLTAGEQLKLAYLLKKLGLALQQRSTTKYVQS